MTGNRRRYQDLAERDRVRREHKKHIQNQKQEAAYNNQVKGHHSNQERNILTKLLDNGTDFRPRFPILLKYPEKDFDAIKKSLKGA